MIIIKKVHLVSIAAILTISSVAGIKSLQKPLAIEVIKPIVTTVEDTVTSTGRVYERKTKSVYAEGTGYIKETYVEVGDEVKEGDKIALFIRTGQEITGNINSESLPAGLDMESYLSQYGADTEGNEKVDAAATEEITLTASASGVITTLNTTGISSKPVAVISDFSELYVKASINESLISKVEEGQTVRITGEGFQGLIYTGTVSNISPVAKQVVNGTYSETVVETTIDILNADLKLRPGFSVEINILTNVSEGAVVVPFEAVTADKEGKDCVYIIEGGQAVKKYIETGLSNSYGIEIKSGIDKNAIVVNNPPDNLPNAAELTLKK